jgi:hypothetical protein
MRSSVRSSALPWWWLVGARPEGGYRLAHHTPQVLVAATPEQRAASIAEQLADARDPPRFHGLAGPKPARQPGELISRRVHAVACGRDTRTWQTSRTLREEILQRITEHTARPRTGERLGAKCQRRARVRRRAGGQGPVQLRSPEAYQESASQLIGAHAASRLRRSMRSLRATSPAPCPAASTRPRSTIASLRRMTSRPLARAGLP